MFNLGALEVEFFGRVATFDMVTVYGLGCAAVFLTGFIIATRVEKNEQGTSD